MYLDVKKETYDEKSFIYLFNSQQTDIYVLLVLSRTVYVLYRRAKGRKPLENMKEGKPCPLARLKILEKCSHAQTCKDLLQTLQ